MFLLYRIIRTIQLIEMGIRGLETYMRNSKKYGENHVLENTLIIIDTSAFTHSLYDECENNTSEFGGDYDIIANAYADYIDKLLKYKITPIFVLDGAYEIRKIENLEQRMKGRIMLYSKFLKSKYENKNEKLLMPYLATDIIIDILNDKNIPHITCDFEADPEIVALAKVLKCPVVGRDSDYFVNKVSYIPFYSIKYTENGFDCQIYKVQKLLNVYGLHDNYLPLIFILLGNDYIKFELFYELIGIENRHEFDCGIKLRNISAWLKEQENVDVAVEKMNKHLSKKNDPEYVYAIMLRIKKIIQEYNGNTTNSEYLGYILQNDRVKKYISNSDVLLKDLKPNTVNILPGWLISNYRKGLINPIVMTIYTLKSIHFRVQIEDYNQQPYYEVSFKILKRIFGLLSKTNSITGIGRHAKHKLPINNRSDTIQLGMYNIEPYLNEPYVPLDTLNKTTLKYRKNIILNLVGIENIDGVPKEWELFILILIYWVKNTSNYRTSHMYALILNAITFKIIKKNRSD